MVQLGNGLPRFSASATCASDDLDANAVPAAADHLEAIRRVFDAGAFAGRNVVSVLDPTLVEYRRIHVDAGPGSAGPSREVAQAMAGGRDGAERRTGFYDVGGIAEGGRRKRELIAVAAQAGEIDAHAALLRGAGLHPVAIDTVPGALARCLGLETDTHDGAALFIADLRGASPLFVVVGGKCPRFVRRSARHGRAPAESAEESKASVVTPALLDEINLCVHHLCERGARGSVPHAGCVLAPAGSEDPILSALASRIPLPFLPLQDCLTDDMRAFGADLPAPLHDWVVPLGLARRGIQEPVHA